MNDAVITAEGQLKWPARGDCAPWNSDLSADQMGAVVGEKSQHAASNWPWKTHQPFIAVSCSGGRAA